MIHPARFALIAVIVLGAACGKKGPPLAPLHLVPGPATDVSVRRLGTDALVHLVIPPGNVNGPGRAEIDRVEVYAVTVAPGSAPPPNRELLSAKYLVGSIPVKPPPVEDETPPENAPPDTRPSPGEAAMFVEPLTDEKLKPVTFAAPPAPKGSATARAASAAAAGTPASAAGATGTIPPATAAPGTVPSPAATGTPPPAAGATGTPTPPAAPAGTAPAAAGATATSPPPAAVAGTTPPSTTAAGTTPPAAPAGTTLPAAPAGTTPAAAAGTTTPAAAAGMTTPAAAASVPPAAAAIPVPTYPVRIYVTRGMTKRDRAGQPSVRVQLPIVPPPAPPSALTATVTENAVVLKWTPPPVPVADAPAVPAPAVAAPPTAGAPAVAAPAAAPSVVAAPPAAGAPAVDAPAVATPVVAAPPVAAPALLFNVYKPDSTTPINGEPIAGAEYERTGVVFGTEVCFTVRSVEKVAAISIESALSPPYCVTPRDTFPPAQPKAVSVVAGTGTINLSWDANSEPDLAGYLVLRGEAAGGTLQPLTPAPIAGTNFEDKTVRPGVRYAYAIVAVDKAVPPNSSAPSARIEETAR